MHPFDPRTILFAKHAQDLVSHPLSYRAIYRRRIVRFNRNRHPAQRTCRRRLIYNLAVAAISTIPGHCQRPSRHGSSNWKARITERAPAAARSARKHFELADLAVLVAALSRAPHRTHLAALPPSNPTARGGRNHRNRPSLADFSAGVNGPRGLVSTASRYCSRQNTQVLRGMVPGGAGARGGSG